MARARRQLGKRDVPSAWHPVPRRALVVRGGERQPESSRNSRSLLCAELWNIATAGVS